MKIGCLTYDAQRMQKQGKEETDFTAALSVSSQKRVSSRRERNVCLRSIIVHLASCRSERRCERQDEALAKGAFPHLSRGWLPRWSLVATRCIGKKSFSSPCTTLYTAPSTIVFAVLAGEDEDVSWLKPCPVTISLVLLCCLRLRLRLRLPSCPEH